MNELLYDKVKDYNFEELFKQKGYRYYTNGSYNLNIIGIRSKDYDCKNIFNDLLVVIYKVNKNDKEQRRIFSFSTKPGTYYLKNPLSYKGTAILVPNQYRNCWSIGKHNGQYKALVQTNPVTVYRDDNKDDVYDLIPETKEKGIFGINIHRASAYNKTVYVDKYSAGCQIMNDPRDFVTFMNLCEKQSNIYGNSFTYTLIEEKDLK